MPTKCPFNKCDGSGLLPFILPDGTASLYSKVFCECHEVDQHEYIYPIKPSDIDFSVSYPAYRSLCQEHGWTDPGPDKPSREAPPLLDSPEPQTWQTDQWQSVKQLKGMVLHLDKQVKETMAKKRTEQGQY